MAICLEYQAVYLDRNQALTSIKRKFLAASLLFCVLLGRVWVKIETTSLGYSIAREHDNTVSLENEKSELELKRSVLLRRDVLAQEGMKLGLKPLSYRQARTM
jgi:hypothetical protein